MPTKILEKKSIFFKNHGFLNIKDQPQWLTVKGRSRQYIKPITQSYAGQVRLNCPVASVRRYPDHVEVQPQNEAAEKFDQVVIATHSDQALAILTDASPLEREVLGAIPYQENEAVLHTDASVLPQRRLAWAAWNYHLLAREQERVALTYNMNILQGLEAPVEFCVTLNNTRAIDPRKIIRTITYDHPVLTREAVAAQKRQGEINGVNRTYFCGAYWRNGFHEDGVVSALAALKHFDERHGEQELHLRRAG